jgi:hypothetical protein
MWVLIILFIWALSSCAAPKAGTMNPYCIRNCVVTNAPMTGNSPTGTFSPALGDIASTGGATTKTKSPATTITVTPQ